MTLSEFNKLVSLIPHTTNFIGFKKRFEKYFFSNLEHLRQENNYLEWKKIFNQTTVDYLLDREAKNAWIDFLKKENKETIMLIVVIIILVGFVSIIFIQTSIFLPEK